MRQGPPCDAHCRIDVDAETRDRGSSGAGHRPQRVAPASARARFAAAPRGARKRLSREPPGREVDFQSSDRRHIPATKTFRVEALGGTQPRESPKSSG